MNLPRVVIIGGGFAGINAARTLKNTPCEITLIDKKNHHLFQPLLYQAATATLSPRDISIALREICAGQDNVNVMMGEVVKIEKEKKLIILGNGDIIEYDYLVVAIGSKHSYFGNDHWEGIAPGIKTLRDALTIRETILTSFEKAERLDSISESYKYLTFVIVGGGPTGVEFAGTIAELIRKTMRKNFRRIKTERARVFLIEGSDRLLSTFHPKLSARTKRDLEKLGVTVLTKRIVTNITPEGVEVGDTFIEAKNVIWAAGNTIPAMINSLDVEQDRQGRVMVEPDLSIPGHPEVFVLGDAAHTKNSKGHPLPGVATFAIQEGRFCGRILKKEIKSKKKPKKRKEKFRSFDKGSLATIGSWKAVGSFRKFRFTGLLAWFVWGVVHVAYLIGFRNRLSVMFEWVIHHLTGARSARIIHGSIDEDLPKREDP